MTKARKTLIDVNTTPYYHCIARCVRRAYLCGEDHYTGRNYEHRKQWIVDEIKKLGEVFAIDICAYAIMSNHYHLVLHINKEQAETWSEREVIERWYSLFKGHVLVDRYLNYEKQGQGERDATSGILAKWRKRLMNISWFMRCLNEHIARRANEEDRCKGRFWEGRYKSQALLDQTALLTCMMYVDLNPIRAGINNELESSDFTSIQARIAQIGQTIKTSRKDKKTESKKASAKRAHITAKQAKRAATKAARPKLFRFAGNERADSKPGIPFGILDYLELIDWTGRAVRDDKAGHIPSHIQPILQKLNINQENWLDNVTQFERKFYKAVGPRATLKRISGNMRNRQWFKGIGHCDSLYRSPPAV